MLVACGGSHGDDAASFEDAPSSDGSGSGANVSLPPLDGKLDYQLGGAYTPPAGVTIVSRDREAAPADGIYNICYVNGFQIQPAEESFWTSQHPDLILRDGNGTPITIRTGTRC